MDRARAWWASKEYAEAKGLRQACAATEMVLLEAYAAAIGLILGSLNIGSAPAVLQLAATTSSNCAARALSGSPTGIA
jgi:aminoglycoside phosphotransferase (APT) family kinase protein